MTDISKVSLRAACATTTRSGEFFASWFASICGVSAREPMPCRIMTRSAAGGRCAAQLLFIAASNPTGNLRDCSPNFGGHGVKPTALVEIVARVH